MITTACLDVPAHQRHVQNPCRAERDPSEPIRAGGCVGAPHALNEGQPTPESEAQAMMERFDSSAVRQWAARAASLQPIRAPNGPVLTA